MKDENGHLMEPKNAVYGRVMLLGKDTLILEALRHETKVHIANKVVQAVSGITFFVWLYHMIELVIR